MGHLYQSVKVHVPAKTHEKIQQAVTQSRPISVKIDLTETPEHRILATPGQIRKIQHALEGGKKEMTLRFSRRQAAANLKVEGGFLGAMLAMATKFLPEILAGIATSAASSAIDKSIKGSGMFLGKRRYAVRIQKHGDGLVFTPVDHERDGFYVKHEGRIYQGTGLLHNLLKNIPLLNIIF